MGIHNELGFELEICRQLEQGSWLHSPKDSGFDASLALFGNDVLSWLAETQPEQFEKIVKPNDSPQQQEQAKQALLRRLGSTLDLPLSSGGGTLNVLRRGFKDGSARFDMCQFRPADDLNPATWERYRKVRLRVVQQVHYSKSNRNSIDLVLFVNGLPVATVELKTDFTQNVQDAISQYKYDRSPRGEMLLSFGHRALVHFAVSNSEVWMTTKLDGEKSLFLPFNKGDDGRSGNPINPDGSKTAYLWEEVWERDNWLEILGRFMHLNITEDIDVVTGKKTKRESLLFPRYHQWRAVKGLVDASKVEGAGQKYLIQHSAGSGKTNSIAWVAHQLSTLHLDAGSKAFDSVIVVTDRTVLDRQLQDAITQIDSKSGVVAAISSKDGSKSAQLEEALKAGKPIIVVTLQTFPFVFNQIQDAGSTQSKKFAIIADEAHSSQTGSTAAKLKAVLTDSEKQDFEDGGEVDFESMLLAEMEGRANPRNISFYAFTATPKAKTLELFGRPNADGLPEPFDVYSMQQAIEEEFILDVLQNYTSYKVAFKLAHNGQEYDSNAPLVDQSEALKELMRWVRLHPTNISSKVSIIVEHFRQNIARLLDHKAKAMVVTSSRKEAVRYKLAFDAYIKEKGYKDLKALVAFSGQVFDKDSGPEPFTEQNMNPDTKRMSLPEAFKTTDYQVMLVANKFQTGFDQPLLVAMYVDKKLSGVTAVQTLSRLNRRATGKDATYVLDFVNDPNDILEAFKPYFRDAQLQEITDPNLIHDIQSKLDHAGIYEQHHVENAARVFLEGAGRTGHNKLSAALAEPVDRFWKKLDAARDSGDSQEVDRLYDFRKTVESFLKTHGFLSQLYNYEDTDVEKHYLFFKFLSREIHDAGRTAKIDVSEVELVAYAIRKDKEAKLELDDGSPLQPLTGVGGGVPHDQELAALAEAVQKLNAMFDLEGVTESDTRNIVVWVTDKAMENDTVKTQASKNTRDQFLESNQLRETVLEALVAARSNAEALSAEFLESKQKIDRLTEAVGELLHLRVNKNGG
jgi:type I restriction enzyme R subunit